MKTSFTLAVLAFASTTSAIKLTVEADLSSTSTTGVITPDSCDSTVVTDVRDPTDRSKILQGGWADAFNVIKPVSSFGWGKIDLKQCNDGSIRNYYNQCLTWMGMSTDESTGANSGYVSYNTCGGDMEVNQSFTMISTSYADDNVSLYTQPIYVHKNDASGLCLTGSGLLTDDCDSGVMWRTKISIDQQSYLRNVGTGLCLVPEANDENARVVSVECDDDDNQKWVSFGNHEIAHEATGYCLGTSAGKMGIFSISSCADNLEQGFVASGTAGKIQYTWMADRTKSIEAVSFEGYAVAPRTTSASDYQYWQWVDTNEWADAEFTWVEVGCGNGVEMSHSYSEEFTAINGSGSRSVASDDFVLSARDELLGQTLITNSPGVEASAVEYLTKTYSDMMNHPSDPTIDRSHLFTCSGENNCMYRSVMTMQNNYESESLEWITGFTKCMSGNPVCPPLTTYDTTSSTCIVSE